MKLEVEIAGRIHIIQYTGDFSGSSTVMLNGVPVAVEARMLRPGILSLVVSEGVNAGRAWRVVLEDDANDPAIHIAGERISYRVDDPRSLKGRRASAGGADGPKPIKASMPGRVVRVLAQQGEDVGAHQGIVVIEAMKMQNEMKSPKAGRVAELRITVGDTVSAGDVLAVIE